MKFVRNFFKQNQIFLLLSIIFGLICLGYFTRGFYFLIIDKQVGAADLYSRWQEQQYIYRGSYPYDVTAGSLQVDPELGAVTSGFYPPWAFFMGFIVFPPIPFELTRWYHLILNTISLIILATFAYQIGRSHGKSKAWFIVIACLSISSHATTLGTGQYGIIINALLIGMFWLLEKNRNVIAGLIFGLALAKPNISALYFLILIIRKNTQSVLACLFYVLLASLTIGFATQVSPIYMLAKTVNKSKYFVKTGYSGVNVFINLGIEPTEATIMLALFGTAILITIFYFFRHHSLIFLFAIAAVIGRLWTYHLAYDNVMLIFLLLAMFKITFQKYQFSNVLLLSLVLVSLLIPSSITDLAYVRIAQSIIWISALIYLLIHEKQFRMSTDCLSQHS